MLSRGDITPSGSSRFAIMSFRRVSVVPRGDAPDLDRMDSGERPFRPAGAGYPLVAAPSSCSSGRPCRIILGRARGSARCRRASATGRTSRLFGVDGRRIKSNERGHHPHGAKRSFVWRRTRLHRGRRPSRHAFVSISRADLDRGLLFVIPSRAVSRPEMALASNNKWSMLGASAPRRISQYEIPGALPSWQRDDDRELACRTSSAPGGFPWEWFMYRTPLRRAFFLWFTQRSRSTARPSTCPSGEELVAGYSPEYSARRTCSSSLPRGRTCSDVRIARPSSSVAAGSGLPGEEEANFSACSARSCSS